MGHFAVSPSKLHVSLQSRERMCLSRAVLRSLCASNAVRVRVCGALDAVLLEEEEDDRRQTQHAVRRAGNCRLGRGKRMGIRNRERPTRMLVSWSANKRQKYSQTQGRTPTHGSVWVCMFEPFAYRRSAGGRPRCCTRTHTSERVNE